MMSTATNSSTPPWLREDVDVVQPLNNAASANRPNESHSQVDSERKSKVVYWILKLTTMFLCALIVATAIIGIQYIDGVEASGKIFVAVYMIFFSSLLFTFELMEIKPTEWVDHLLRRNFGFLYGTMGKSLYIVFIACLSFGLGDPQNLTYATGISTAIFGIVEFTLYLKYPELFEGSV